MGVDVCVREGEIEGEGWGLSVKGNGYHCAVACIWRTMIITIDGNYYT